MPTNRIEELWSAPAMGTNTPRYDEEETQRSELPAWLRKVEQFLVDHPQTTVAAALAVGLTLGWLGKRK